jgi:hypothetical protein
MRNLSKAPLLVMYGLLCLSACASSNGLLVPFAANGRLGYVDTSMRLVIKPAFIKASPFSATGHAIVRYGTNDCAVIDQTGRDVLRLSTPVLMRILDDYYAYYANDLVNIIELDPRRMIATGLREVRPSFGDSIPVRFYSDPPDAGYIGLDGRRLLPDLRLQRSNQFIDGLATVTLPDWNSGIIDESGHLVGANRFLRIGEHFSEGLVFAESDDRSTGYVDIHGNFAFKVPVVISEDRTATNFVAGLAMIQTQQNPSTWRIIDKKGNFKSVALKIDSAEDFVEGASIVSAVDKNGMVRFGFLKDTAAYLVEPKFDSAERFVHGYAMIKLDGRDGLLDHSGKIAWSDEILKTER